MVMAETAVEAGSRYTEGERRGEAPELEPGSRNPPEPELVLRPEVSPGSRGGSGPAETVGGVTWGILSANENEDRCDDG